MNLRSVSELATALFPPDYLQDSLIDEIQMVQKKLTHLRETPGPLRGGSQRCLDDSAEREPFSGSGSDRLRPSKPSGFKCPSGANFLPYELAMDRFAKPDADAPGHSPSDSPNSSQLHLLL